MLQIRVALFLYKLGQTLLQIEAASLLKIRASVVTNWGSYYKLGQPLLQNRAAITNWGQNVVQIGASHVFSRVIECLEQNIRKQIDRKKPSCTKQMNREQNIRIKICKYEYYQVSLVLLNYNKQGRHN